MKKVSSHPFHAVKRPHNAALQYKSALALLLVSGGLLAAAPAQAQINPDVRPESAKATDRSLIPCVKSKNPSIAPCVKNKHGDIVPCVKNKTGGIAPCVKTKTIAPAPTGQ